MFIVIGIMFGGIAIGYLLRKASFWKHIGKPINLTIVLLLFLLGIQVGSDQTIINNLPLLGGQALLLAIAGTLGSVLAGWAVYVFAFKQKKKES